MNMTTLTALKNLALAVVLLAGGTSLAVIGFLAAINKSSLVRHWRRKAHRLPSTPHQQIRLARPVHR